MKKANFFFFLTLLHAPTHPYPSSLSASCLHPSFPFSDPPSFFLTLSPESLPYSPSSPPYHLPTSSLHPPYILPTTSLHPPYILSASSLHPPCYLFGGMLPAADISCTIYRPGPSRPPPHPPRRFSVFSPTSVGLSSEGRRRDLGETSELMYSWCWLSVC